MDEVSFSQDSKYINIRDNLIIKTHNEFKYFLLVTIYIYNKIIDFIFM